MRYAVFFLCAVLLAQEPTGGTPGSITPRLARIEGRVSDQNGQPVPYAQVVLSSRMARQSNTATARQDGTFRFEGLAPGNDYMLRAGKDGYLDGVFGVRAGIPQGGVPGFRAPPSAPVSTFPLKLGETMTAELILIGQAVVTGRVTTPEGDPVPEASVQLRQASYNLGFLETGTVGRAETDDRGAYRIAGLSAGRYYLLASTAAGTSSSHFTVEPVVDEDVTTFYPGVATMEKVRPIELTPGADTKADIIMRRGDHYRLSASLVDPSGAGLPNYLLAPRRLDVDHITTGDAHGRRGARGDSGP